MVPGIEPRLGRLVPGKPGQAVGDISGIAGLRHLPVIDDVDADRSLAADDVDDRLAHQPVERVLVIRLALILAHQHLPQLGRARQAADMGRQDAVLTRLHRIPRVNVSQPRACAALVRSGNGQAAAAAIAG